MTCQSGKFQGMTARTGPTASRVTQASADAPTSTVCGASRRSRWVAYQRAVVADLSTSPRASRSGLPISAVMRVASESRCASRHSAIETRRVARSARGTWAHDRAATDTSATADSTAASSMGR